MLFIIAHHFVVNSGVTENYDFQNPDANMIYLQLFGMWGKPAINAFILISGFYLCEMTLTWQRWFKVYLQWKAYRIVIFVILLIIGYESLSAKGLFTMVFDIARGVNKGFIASFLFFYLLVPFYNVLIKHLNKKAHLLFVGIFLMFFTFFGTFLKAQGIFTESAWYTVLYLVAAYIKKYSPNWTENLKTSVIGLLCSIMLSMLSVIVLDFVGAKMGGRNYAYYMISDSNKLLAFLGGLFVFLLFKNMKPRANRFVNSIASTVFGVLCIHASSDAMRIMLWKDIVDVRGAYYKPTGELILYSIGIVFAVFIACAVCDYLRLKFIEKPLFKSIDRKTMGWKVGDRNILKRTLAMYNSIEKEETL